MPNLSPRDVATVHTKQYGDFHFGILSVNRVQLLAQIDTNLGDREYTVQVLHLMLQALPERSLEEVSALPDRVLRRLVHAFSASRYGLNATLPARCFIGRPLP